jgi:hypothetical protein
MHSSRVTGVDSSDAFSAEIRAAVNTQELMDFVDKDAVLLRYPPNMLMQRTHTFVPGSEAYSEVRSLRICISTSTDLERPHNN